MRIALLLLCSGFCALVYQVAWLRELRLVFGASTPASAAVLAVFMGGLGYGSLALSRRAEQAPRPLAYYGLLEAGIGITAAISPALLYGVRWLYVLVGGTHTLGIAGGTVVRLLLSAIVLLPPTLLMGGTLPAAARAAASAGDAGRRSTALLYGMNTLGAVLGAGLSTFVLLEIFGTRVTLWLGCLVNLLVALVARRVDRTLPAPADEKEEDAPAKEAAAPARFVLAASGAVGFVFLLMELAWYRMLGPLLGGSTYTFGLILAVALAGIGAGGLLYARVGAAAPTLTAFAVSCALEALCLAIPYALGDRVALGALMLRSFGVAGLWGHVLGWTVVSGIVVFPAAVVAGYQFPLLIALLGSGSRRVARHVGLAYTFNTAGAILGSLGGGFLLLPALGAVGTWKLCTWLLAGLGCAAAFSTARGGAVTARALVPALAAVLAPAIMQSSLGPSAVWRHAPIGVGRADGVLADATRNKLEEWRRATRRGFTWETEGRESSIALHTAYQLSFIVNGKSDGSAISDAGTQVMSGLLGSLRHGQVKNALVIGLGTGTTAGWLGAVPAIESVDVLELEPAIVEVARRCAGVNHGALDNPKVHLEIADARETLLTTRSRYDLIVSEPSNPYRAGIASLFTHEYYEAVSERLADDGVFVQWIQAYDVDAESATIVYATLKSVFSVVESWQTQRGDLILLAGAALAPIEADVWRERIAEPTLAEALRVAWRVDSVEGVLGHFVAAPSFADNVAAVAGPDRVNTDDRNLLEFALARSLGRGDDFSIELVKRIATLRGEGRASVTGEIDWPLVEDASAAVGLAASPPNPQEIPSRDVPTSRRRRALAEWARGDIGGARSLWDSQPEPPKSPIERLVVAELYAATDDERADPLIDALRRAQPVEAAVLAARRRLGKDDFAGGVALLVEAFVAYRTDPWAHLKVMERALTVATIAGKTHPDHARALADVLSQPFAALALDESRARARFELSLLVADPAVCLAALEALGPHVPWEQRFLEQRLGCLERAESPHADLARLDLGRFLEDEGLELAAAMLPAR